MKKILILLIFISISAKADNHPKFYIEEALKNNHKLNAERK